MDAKQLGLFISERRKELGLTQALLAKQLCVTDKAVSRWERGIGLPDICNMEALAAALNVSLIELFQAQRNNSDNMSTKEAEALLLDTIQLSKDSNKLARRIGRIILVVFLAISILLLLLLVSAGKIVAFSVGSIIAGLIAWGIPIWQATLAKTSRIIISSLFSFGFALLSLMLQFLDIANEIHTGDMAAVEDTIDVLVMVVFVFIVITFLVNTIMAGFSKHKQ